MKLKLENLKKLIKEEIEKKKLIEVDYEEEMPDDYQEGMIEAELEKALRGAVDSLGREETRKIIDRYFLEN